MKQLLTLLFFMAISANASVLAQNKNLSLGLFYLPNCGDHVGHVTLGYYQSVKQKLSFGLKAMVTSDIIGMPANQMRTFWVNTDLVSSWRFSCYTNRAWWRFDAGVSMLSIIEKTPPNSVLECGVGMSETQLEKYLKGYTNVNYRPGLATAANLEFTLTRKLGLGIGVTSNLYWPSKTPPDIIIMPNVNLVRCF